MNARRAARSVASVFGATFLGAVILSVAPAVPSALAAEELPVITSVTPDEGPTSGGLGNAIETMLLHGVKITGEHLEHATEVKFAGWSAAGFVALSETELLVEPPAHEPESPEHEEGKVAVSVTNLGGTTEHAKAYRYGPSVEAVERVDDATNEGSINPPIRCAEPNTLNTLAECPEDSERALGTVVRIKGNGFTEGTPVVHFGVQCNGSLFSPNGCAEASTAGTVLKDTPTELEVIAPHYKIPSPATGVPTGAPVHVTVTTAGGTSPESAADRYYFGPQVESVTPNQGSQVGGTTLRITGHGFEAPQLVCTGETEKALSECASPSERSVEVISLVQSVKFGPPLAVQQQPSPHFTVLSATEIEAVTPHAGTGTELANVTVTTTERGEEATNQTVSLEEQDDSTHFYFGPNITAITPRGGSTAGGNPVTIHGHGFEVCKEPKKTVQECPEGEVEKISEVLFGANAVEHFEVKSPEEIAVPEVPAHPVAEQVDVHVNFALAGQSPTSESDHYTYGLPVIERMTPSQGDENGGTEVTITGANLSGVKEVRFGPQPAQFQEANPPTELRVTTPVFPVDGTTTLPGLPPGTPVTIVNGIGSSHLNPASIFATLPAPEISKIEPASAPSSGGTRVRIVGHFFRGLSHVDFGPNPASFTVLSIGEEIQNVTGAGEIVATVPSGTPGNVYITVTGRGGTSTPTATSRFSYQGFGVEPESFEVDACKSPLTELEKVAEESEKAQRSRVFCNYLNTPPSDFFTQAAGTPGTFIVKFGLNSTEIPQLLTGNRQPSGVLRNLRVDFPPGLNFDVQAVKEFCSLKVFEEEKSCPEKSQVGVAEVTADSGHSVNVPDTVQTVHHPVYALAPKFGAPAELGFKGFEIVGQPAQVQVVGGLSWAQESGAEEAYSGGAPAHRKNGLATGDDHVFSTVERANDKLTPTLSSTLILGGSFGNGAFVTMPSQCGGGLTTHLRVDSYDHAEAPLLAASNARNETAEASTTTPAGIEGCGKVPFHPTVEMKPETGAAGAPDGATVTVKVPHESNPDTADPHQVTVALPEGMTVNPSSANGLVGCTDKQFGVKETEPGSGVFQEHPLRVEEGEVHCPPESKIGSFQVKTPDLPTEACKEAGKVFAECPNLSEREQTPLEGGIYVAQPVPGKGPESGEMYRVFLAAESKRFGVQVRQLGSVRANEQTGRLETTVETPQLPFSEAIVHFNGGQKASLANPVGCSAGGTVGTFVPYGGPEGPPTAQFESPFNLEACPFSSPFALSQGAGTGGTQAGANTTFALEWTRPRGQAYLAATNTTLPPGLTGSIASVPVLCNEEQANAGACPAASQIGTVLTAAGEGEPEPGESLFNSKNLITLGGQVYLTNSYTSHGIQPYGLAIVVPAEKVGPYNLGTIVTRAGIQINEETAQVTTTVSEVPTIVKGAPVRLRAIQIQLNRAGFMRNATHCSAGSIESTLYGTGNLPAPREPGGALKLTSLSKDELKTGYAATGCGSLPFKPVFTSSTSANTSRQSGASLTVKYTQNPGETNIQKVETQLPIALPSRLTTLQKACTETQFAANPAGCPGPSNVGTVVAHTPLLNTPLTGTAILVSHGGRAYPDLDFVLHEVAGIKVRVVGHTEIKNGITYSRFENVPDTPVSSFELNLPQGPNSLLGSNGSFCTETKTSKKKVALKNNGKVVRRQGHVVYTTREDDPPADRSR